jgi:hypothetical protein
MAELLAEDPKLRPTTAIKRLIGNKNDSDIRRLQVKWNAEGRILLSQTQERRERRPASARATPWHDPRVMQRISEMLGPWATTRLAWPESSSVKAAIEAQARLAELFKPSPAIQTAIQAQQARLAELFKPSPAIQTAIQAQARLAELFKPSPAIQAAIQAMKPSPAMGTMIEAMNRHRR